MWVIRLTNAKKREKKKKATHYYTNDAKIRYR